MPVISVHAPLYGVSSSKTALLKPQGIQHQIAKVRFFLPTGEIAVVTDCGNRIDAIVLDVTEQELVRCRQCDRRRPHPPALVMLLHPNGWTERLADYLQRVKLSAHQDRGNGERIRSAYNLQRERAELEAQEKFEHDNPRLFDGVVRHKWGWSHESERNLPL